MNSRTFRWLPFIAAALALLSWNPGPAALAADVGTARIAGDATYRERIALPSDAVFEAALEGAPRSDGGPGATIARVRDENPGQVPIAFEIPVDLRRLDPRGSYVVRASIYVGDRLRFTGTQAYSVPAQGQRDRVTVLMRGVSEDDDREGDRGRGWRDTEAALGSLPATFVGVLPCADCEGLRYRINLLPDGAYMQAMAHLRDGRDEVVYELGAWSLSPDGRAITLDGGGEGPSRWSVRNRRTLRKLDRGGGPITSRASYDLTRRAGFEGLEPRVELSGMFRYTAAAPRLRDCRSGLQWPVAMSDDYRALERAYMERRGRRGSELLVFLKARIEERPRVEGGGTEPFLVVERFLRAMPGGDCPGTSSSNGGLENTRWRPVRIGDRRVIVSGQEREPWILLDPVTKRATGSGGCNGISGGYEAGARTLRFTRIIRTQMACPSLETENAFLGALERTRQYRVRDRTLDLLDDAGRVLARLEERTLR